MMKIKIVRQVLECNEDCSNDIKELLNEKSVYMINVMGSPGAGKTSLIIELINELKRQYNIGVIEGDIAGQIDAEKIDALGIPVRLEVGPKDIENNQVVLVRRDNREKLVVSIDELEVKLEELLEDIQKSLFEKAKTLRDEKTYSATTMEEFKEIADTKPGFIKSMWCGETACEEKIKEIAGTSSRCMPFNQENLSSKCVCCGKDANHLVYWGKAY